MPLVFKNRCDNEAYMTMDVDLDGIENFIKEHSEENYTLFGIVIAAIIKTIHNRSQLNRFITNNNIYQRNHVSAAFVVKKSLSDDSEEKDGLISMG